MKKKILFNRYTLKSEKPICGRAQLTNIVPAIAQEKNLIACPECKLAPVDYTPLSFRGIPAEHSNT